MYIVHIVSAITYTDCRQSTVKQLLTQLLISVNNTVNLKKLNFLTGITCFGLSFQILFLEMQDFFFIVYNY